MGRDKKNERLDPFTPLIHRTMDCPAWLALSPTAKALYPAVKRRVGRHTGKNGVVFLSVRDAAEYLGASPDTASRAFHDLQRKGFLVARTVGTLGISGEAKATTWELTEIGTADEPRPSNLFLDWRSDAEFPVKKGRSPARAKTDRCPKSRTMLSDISDVLEVACPKSRTTCPKSRTFGG
jgi:DNA-binding transcriptional MocR family regulator